MTPAVRVPPSACTTVQFDEDLPLAQLLPGRCITGAGGSGKTALALRLASELRPAFAERVWLIELAPLADPSLVLSTVAADLGVRDIQGARGRPRGHPRAPPTGGAQGRVPGRAGAFAGRHPPAGEAGHRAAVRRRGSRRLPRQALHPSR